MENRRIRIRPILLCSYKSEEAEVFRTTNTELFKLTDVELFLLVVGIRGERSAVGSTI